MFVPVGAVGGVEVPVVQVVDVVSVRHLLVTASGSVLVGVLGVFDATPGLAFVPVVAVLVMEMPVVDVVDVVAVFDGHVAAVGTVHMGMRMIGDAIDGGTGHASIVSRRKVRSGSDPTSGRVRVWNVGMELDRLVDRVLDASVVGGYSRLGYAVRARTFESIPNGALAGQTVVVTGPTSGLGLATSVGLRRLGASLVLIGRDAGRLSSTTRMLQARIPEGGPIEELVADMGDLETVARAAAAVRDSGRTVRAVVHNAGALDAERGTSPQGFERTVATHVLGPHLFTLITLPVVERVVTVSSGGMYAASLPGPAADGSPEMPPGSWDGTRQYALAKRAQVTLNEMWSRREASTVFAAMHPGWADTPGVRSSIPVFARLTGPILRTAEQGADTVVWLAAADRVPTGRFWCDRSPRPIHRLPATRRSDTPEARSALWEWCDRAVRPYR